MLFSLTIGKQARMKFEPGSGKRQEHNFEIVVNHITTNKTSCLRSRGRAWRL